MAVNIFGSGPKSRNGNVIVERGRPGIGFKYLDTEGNFDINNKRLANLGVPSDDNDAVNKKYVDDENKIMDARIENNYDELNHEYSNLSVSFQNLKTDLDVDLRHNSDRFLSLENNVEDVRNAVEVDVAAKLSENDNIRNIELEKKLLEQRVYIDELIAGLRTFSSNLENKLKSVSEDSTNIQDIISGVTDDMRINFSEIETIKATINILQRKFNDLGTSDVVYTTVAGLDDRIKILETDFNSVKGSIDLLKEVSDSASTRYSMGIQDILERLASLKQLHNRLVSRVNSERDDSVKKSEFEGLEQRVNNLDSTDSHSLSSKLYTLEEKINNMTTSSELEDRVNALVRSNILLEERLRPLLTESRRDRGEGFI